jgi:HEAT repeat protein
MKITRRSILPACLTLLSLISAATAARAQDLKSTEPKQRAQAAERLGKRGGATDIPALAELLKDPVQDVRSEAVGAIIRIGTQHSLPPLIEATRDAVPEIQATAVDGLVNFYYIGYVKTGWTAALKSIGSDLKNRFRQPEPIIIDPYVTASDDVVDAIARVIVGGTSMESRANAARAAGILRGKRALPQLLEALRSKNSTIILESVRAIEKIGDLSVGPSLTFLLRDLDEDVQLAVVQAMGQLLVKEAVPDLVDLVKTSDRKRIRRQALISLAKIPETNQRALFQNYLSDRDAQLRAAAAEGIGRAGNQEDRQGIVDAFAKEKSESARLSMAFAAVKLGDYTFLNYLYDGLNSMFHRREASPFLVELARDPEVLSRLYVPLTTGTIPQKKELAYVVSVSGNRDSMPHLEKLTHDPDTSVAQEAIRALKNLQARL